LSQNDYSSKLDEILLKLSRIEKAMKIVPDKEITIVDFDSSLKSYEEYAKEELKLEETTIKNHKSVIRSFLTHSKGRINKETVKDYLDSNGSLTWKSKHLKALRKYNRNFLKLGRWIEEFRFEQASYKPKKDLPTDEQLVLFFNELPEQAQMIFLLLYNSGLRIGEILSLKLSDLEFEQNMIDATNVHKGRTKSSWYSFFTSQTAEWLQNYFENNGILELDEPIFSHSARSVQQAFKTTSEILGLDINPHLLRTVFTEKCRKAGIKDDYINAFCGRTSKTVLAKHYTDYSPNALREQYDTAEPFFILGG